jgi:DNA-binding GntR family transcriptional regulator
MSGAAARKASAVGSSEKVSKVVEDLRELIGRGDLAPGSKLTERQLCARFGISRTPLREALKVLATEGIVRLRPNRAAEVVSFSEAETEALFEIVAVLEGFAGEAACQRASDEQIAAIGQLHYSMMLHYYRNEPHGFFNLNQQIHHHIVAAAGNPVLSWLYDLLAVRLRRARFNASIVQVEKAVKDHEMILDYLIKRDSRALKELLRDHVLYARLPRHASVQQLEGRS